jgi:hypothetical protein
MPLKQNSQQSHHTFDSMNSNEVTKERTDKETVSWFKQSSKVIFYGPRRFMATFRTAYIRMKSVISTNL